MQGFEETRKFYRFLGLELAGALEISSTKTGSKQVLHILQDESGSFLAFFDDPETPFEFKDQQDFDLHIALSGTDHLKMFEIGKNSEMECREFPITGSLTPSTSGIPTAMSRIDRQTPDHDRQMRLPETEYSEKWNESKNPVEHQHDSPEKPFSRSHRDDKIIEEHFGKASRGGDQLAFQNGSSATVDRTVSDSEFDEYTLVYSGKIQVEVDGRPCAGSETVDPRQGGSRVRYSNPFDQPSLLFGLHSASLGNRKPGRGLILRSESIGWGCYWPLRGLQASWFPLLQAPVAQLDRASDCGSEGQAFESLRVRHKNTI